MAHGRSLCDLVPWEIDLHRMGFKAEEVPWLRWSGQEHLGALLLTLSSWENSTLFPRWRLRGGGWWWLALTDEDPNPPYLMGFHLWLILSTSTQHRVGPFMYFQLRFSAHQGCIGCAGLGREGCRMPTTAMPHVILTAYLEDPLPALL